MKFTSEDLLKILNLQVGDRIKVKFDVCSPYYQNTTNSICEIIKNITGHIMIRNENNQTMFIHNLVDIDFEILPKPKRVGDLKCKDFECCDCPIGFLCDYKIPKYAENKEPTLYQMFEYYNVTDQEIHDLLKARLDKVANE